jgi:hypothetical protein
VKKVKFRLSTSKRSCSYHGEEKKAHIGLKKEEIPYTGITIQKVFEGIKKIAPTGLKFSINQKCSKRAGIYIYIIVSQ